MELKKGVSEIRKLDKKRKELSEHLDGIYQRVSPAGGYNESPFMGVAEKLCRVAEKQAIVWNQIRSTIIIQESMKTLWNLAIIAGLDVSPYGEEEILKFGYDELIALIPVSERKRLGVVTDNNRMNVSLKGRGETLSCSTHRSVAAPLQTTLF